MKPYRRATDYTWSRHLSEALFTYLLGNGWTTRLSARLKLHRPIQVERVSILLPAPQALPPLQIVFASDFHAGPSTHPEVIEAAGQAIVAIKPDLVLLGGDYVSLEARHIHGVTAVIQRLTPPFGCYAVLGNHDLWADDVPIVAALRSANATVLLNQSARLPPPYDHVWLCGLDDPRSGRPDAQRALADASGVRIVVMHSPEGLGAIGQNCFDLAFCGHVHGGQICLPGGRPIFLPRGELNHRYIAGRYQLDDHPNATLLVSRGVGYGGVPVRAFAPADIIHCTISWEASRHP
jgi:predicted MPP superfamily phosphohydrolase